ncbi:MAG: PQQ-binding-like beta-propeller repeat protein [Planctomycetes bacterium]|nr:PQQ-binding-like beta-propeller repeat protein [Planctomycetota bacterium]
MRSIREAALVGLSAILAVSVRAEDWPRFRGPGGLAISAEKGVPVTWGETENIVWKIDLPGSGSSSPIVAGGRIYLSSYSGYAVPGEPKGRMDDLRRHVICLDAASGKTLWMTDVESRLPDQATIRDAHGYATSTIACDGERLYVFFGKSGVFALDLAGKELWRADVGSKVSGWGTAASPIVSGDVVIINASVESESLIAFDRKTGKEVWRAGGIKESWNTPIFVEAPGGRTELALAIFGKVLGFDPATGTALWNCDTDIGWYMVPGLVAEEGLIFCIGGRSGGSLAVRAGGKGDVTASHRIWTGKKGSNVSSPIFRDGLLYWAHEKDETVYCAEAATGKILYEERLPRAGQFYPSPVLADGKLYYLSRGGRTFVLAEGQTFRKLAENDLGERETFNASPAVAGGRIYIRSDRRLYAIGKE